MSLPTVPTWTRRRALRSLGGLAALGLLPATVGAFAGGRPRRHLILIELKGGNDALNAFPPYADPLYYRLRPRVALRRDQVLAVDSRLGLHPDLAALLPLWDAGEVALVQGVGYPDPILSHFESARVWETGSVDPEAGLGWLAAAVAQEAAPGEPGAVVYGFNPGPLRQVDRGVLQLISLEGLREPAPMADGGSTGAEREALERIAEVQDQIAACRRYAAGLERLPPVPPAYRRKLLANSLRHSAAMLAAGHPPAIYKLILGGFDTHVGQPELHARQLRELAESLAYFRALLQGDGLWEQVLIVCYSEFGRRVVDNGNFGTDHGTAATQLLIGAALRPGLHGVAPPLDDLDDGNLRWQVDFREVFNLVSSHWMGWPPPLQPARTQGLRLLRA